MIRNLPALLFLACPLLAVAGPGRAGLWEVSTTLNGGVGGFQVAPEQIEQMRQLGIEVPGLSRPFVGRQCISARQAAADGLPIPQAGDSGCTLRNVHHQGALWSADIACAGSLQGTGRMAARFDNTEHVAGTWSFKGRSAQVPGDLDMSSPFSGHWLGPDCAQPGR